MRVNYCNALRCEAKVASSLPLLASGIEKEEES